jgi:YaiO family outer membrane protein
LKKLIISVFLGAFAGALSAQETSADSSSRTTAPYHRIGVSYDYTHFGKQFSADWHLTSIEYARRIKAGTFIGRVNYGNRYSRQGIQLEAEAYPHLSKTFYGYVQLGWSPDFPVFPRFRTGVSLFVNLPKGFEADAGFRYLNFDNDTWMYTGSIGKYAGNFWLNFRTYITPDEKRVSESYNFTTRYYLKSAEDYVFLLFGSGISPDDKSQAAQLNTNYKLQTQRVAAGYRFSFARNIIFLQASYSKVKYLADVKDNQVNSTISYIRNF